MSASPLVTRTLANTAVAMEQKGVPALYMPSLQYTVMQTMASIAADSQIPAAAQTVILAELALAASDFQN